MEFSIQKIRRCGKSALRSHRREAARVVFFTIFLPFLLLLLLGVNLYHNIPGTFIGQNEKVVWIFAGIAAVVFLFFYLPLWLGAKRWYLETCRPGRLRIPSVFYYFFLSVFMAKQSLPVCISPFAKLSFCCWEFYPEAARQSFQL